MSAFRAGFAAWAERNDIFVALRRKRPASVSSADSAICSRGPKYDEGSELHRGTFSCGTELCTGLATDKYVAFCMKRVNLLLHHGIQPTMVFDGSSLPMKRNKNLERMRQRESARSKGEAALAAGEAGAASQHFSKAVGVTHDMAFQLVKALRQAGVQFIVAPYEADAQLAFLSRTGAVDVVITEDSDCLPYGCKKVLFKMDNEGHGQEIQLRNLAANTPLSLCNWKNSMFLDLCLLVGCDYITSSVKGLGITTAHKLVRSHRSLDKIIRAVNSSKFVVPEGYWEQYKMARLTFRHHIIYNPQTKVFLAQCPVYWQAPEKYSSICRWINEVMLETAPDPVLYQTTMNLMPLGDTAKEVDLHFLGPHLQPQVAQGVASGCLLPTSHQPYETAAPLERSAPCYPSPSHKAHTPSQDATSAHSPTLAATGNPSAVTDFLFRDHRVEATSEKDSRVQGYPVPSVQTPSSRAFIDSPFCAGRPALRELPFAALAGVPWGVASPDTAAVWTTEDNHQPSNVSESKGRWGDHSQTEKHFDRNLAVGDVSAYSEEEQTRIYSGLDLSRIRAVEPLADPLSKNFIRRTSSFRARGEEALLPFIPGQESEKGDRGGIVADRQAEHWTTGWGQPDEGVWRQSVWGESDGGEERIDVQYVEGRKHKTCLVQEELALMGSSGVGATTEHACEVDARQGGGELALTGEPPDAGQAKFVPASAQHFHSTQVSQGLETLQRRKRRLHVVREPDGRQHEEARPDNDHKTAEAAMWMVQPADTAQGSRGMPLLRDGSEYEPLAPLSPRSPTRRPRTGSHVENSETRVLTASARRWTLPSSMPPANEVELPLLRLLDGRGEHSWHGRIGGTTAAQPSAKRTRGTEFWDAQLLR